MPKPEILAIVDDLNWFPAQEPVLSERRKASRRDTQAVIEQARSQGVRQVILAERVLPLNPAAEAEVYIATDLITTFDPTLLEVRDEAGRPRFVDLSDPFSRNELAGVEEAAEHSRLSWQHACLIGVRAPEILTNAERTALTQFGGTVLCRSLHHETRFARCCGLRVLALGFAEGVASAKIEPFLGRLARRWKVSSRVPGSVADAGFLEGEPLENRSGQTREPN